ncbi:MAG TPA: hypothetical protein VFB90_06390 [Dehalococcoidia bacterium]|nr:hypothetical protein [Dehalococcoidia bacterium]
MINTDTQPRHRPSDPVAELAGRRFFAWRMAISCQHSLKEVNQAMAAEHAGERRAALAEADRLLKLEMHHWIQRGEALDIILERLPG